MQARVVLIGETEELLVELLTELINDAIGTDYHIGILVGETVSEIGRLAEENVVDLFILGLNNIALMDGNRGEHAPEQWTADLIRSLKLLYQKPVIGFASIESYRKAAKAAGADRILSRPFPPEVFQHEIRSLLAAGDC